MQTIRRIKGTRTHHAKSTDETGAVTAWIFGDDAQESATPFPDEVAARVRVYYANRPEAGRLEFIDERGNVIHAQGEKDEAPIGEAPASLVSLAEQVQEQQVEIDVLKERVAAIEAVEVRPQEND